MRNIDLSQLTAVDRAALKARQDEREASGYFMVTPRPHRPKPGATKRRGVARMQAQAPVDPYVELAAFFQVCRDLDLL